MPSARSPADRLRSADIAFFAALCLFFSAVEYAIPKPLPFLRLGLANLPILCALSKYRVKEIALLVAIKILCQAALSGTLFSYVFVFSAAGSLASAAIMLCVHRMGRRCCSLLGISLAGSMANAAAQSLCSFVLVFKENTLLVVPLLCASSLVTGILTGSLALLFTSQSRWYKTLCGITSPSLPAQLPPAEGRPRRAYVRFFVGLAALSVFLFQTNVGMIWGMAVFFFVVNGLLRKGHIRVLPSLLVTVTVTGCALLSPTGKVLATTGPLVITSDALLRGLHRSGVLVGSVAISQFAISRELRIRGKAGDFVRLTFVFFERLTARGLPRAGHLFDSIDARLVACWTGTEAASEVPE